jgi:hypothetical protein
MPSNRSIGWTLAAVTFILLPFILRLPPGLYVIVPVLLLLVCFAGMVIGTIAARFNKESKAGKRFGILFLVCAAAVVAAMVQDMTQAGADRAAAEKIIGALDAYHRANGHYPDTLAMLVPAHIDEVPGAPPESHFFYRKLALDTDTGRTEAFELAYASGFKIYQVYNSVGRAWVEDEH